MGRASILDKLKIQELIAKNASPSYGLTIVFGRPLPEVLTARIRDLRADMEALIPGRICWYEDWHLHSTIYAPKRGRYSPVRWELRSSGLQAPLPITRRELPDNFYDIVGLVNRIQPFELELHTLSFDQRGGIALVGTPNNPDPVLQLKRIADTIERGVPKEERKLDLPKHPTPDLHTAIGHFRYLEPLAPQEEEIFATKAHLQLVGADESCCLQRALELPAVEVRQVSLVHYGDRLLRNVIGMVVLKLGGEDRISEEEFYQCLGIF